MCRVVLGRYVPKFPWRERDWRLVLVGLGIVNVDEWVQSAKMWPKRGFVANCGMRLNDAPPLSATRIRRPVIRTVSKTSDDGSDSHTLEHNKQIMTVPKSQ